MFNDGSGYYIEGNKNVVVKLYHGHGTVAYTFTPKGKEESDLYDYYFYNIVKNEVFILGRIAKELNTFLIKKRLKKYS